MADPQGITFDSQPIGAASSGGGVTFDSQPIGGGSPDNGQPAAPAALQMSGDPTTLSGGLHNIAAGLNSVSTGVIHGALDTVGGGLHIADNVANAARGLVGAAPIQDNLTDAIDREKQKLAPLEQVNPTASAVGRGGESLVEFLMGDEALKGLSFADRLTHAAKTAKILEKSPQLMKAFQIGAEALNTGVRQGAVQAVQSGVKSGGDLGEAAAGGLTAGVVGGALHGAGGLIGEGLSAAGDAGKKVQELGDVAADAPDKRDLSADLADTINKNQQLLKDNYGSSLDQYKNATSGHTLVYKETPFYQAAKTLLGKGAQEGDEFDKAFHVSRPGSSKVNDTLRELVDMGEPPKPAAPEEWVDANGVKHVEAAPNAEPPKPVALDMPTLLEKRALVRERLGKIKGYSSEELADKEVYGDLLEGIDNTIGQMFDKAGKPDLAEEYDHLRKNYKAHINQYNDPVIKKLTNPKGAPDDAAHAFIGIVKKSGLPQASVVQQHLDTLQKVLDPLGTADDKPLKQFGSQVFQTLLGDASEGGHFNASKFMDTWSKIDGPTQQRLFDVSPEATTDVSKMVQDAKDVANVQRLTRVGLLGAGLGTAGHSILALHPGAGLGVLGMLGLVNETAGVQAGRSVLDYIANHPLMWKTFRGLGAAAENPGVQNAAGAAEPVVAHQAAEAVTK